MSLVWHLPFALLVCTWTNPYRGNTSVTPPDVDQRLIFINTKGFSPRVSNTLKSSCSSSDTSMTEAIPGDDTSPECLPLEADNSWGEAPVIQFASLPPSTQSEILSDFLSERFFFHFSIFFSIKMWFDVTVSSDEGTSWRWSSFEGRSWSDLNL